MSWFGPVLCVWGLLKAVGKKAVGKKAVGPLQEDGQLLLQQHIYSAAFRRVQRLCIVLVCHAAAFWCVCVYVLGLQVADMSSLNNIRLNIHMDPYCEVDQQAHAM